MPDTVPDIGPDAVPDSVPDVGPDGRGHGRLTPVEQPLSQRAFNLLDNDVFTDDVSPDDSSVVGRSRWRESLEALLEAVTAGQFDDVVIWEVPRLARDRACVGGSAAAVAPSADADADADVCTVATGGGADDVESGRRHG